MQVIYPSLHQQSKYIRLFCHPIRRAYYRLFPVTQSEDPIYKYPSPHQQILLYQLLFREIFISQFILLTLKFIPVTKSAEPIVPIIVWKNYYQSIETVDTTVYFLSPHPQILFSPLCFG